MGLLVDPKPPPSRPSRSEPDSERWPRPRQAVHFVAAELPPPQRAARRDNARSKLGDEYSQDQACVERRRPRFRKIAGSRAAGWAGEGELPRGGRDSAWRLDDRRAIRSQAMDARKAGKKAHAL